jgi:hypothetical protein
MRQGRLTSASTRVLAAGLAVGCAGLASVSMAAGRSSASSSLQVAVSGAPKRPVFTLVGNGLQLPGASPTSWPTSQTGCDTLKVGGDPGHDYGTNFYLLAWDGQPGGQNNLRIAAGRYRPTFGELDCIGLVVLSHSPTKLTFTLGHAYADYYKPQWIQKGDVVNVVLNGVSVAGIVQYP